MIRIMSELAPHMLGFEARGRVTTRDYETVMRPGLDQAVRDQGGLRVLYHFGPAFEGFSVGAMFDDARLGLTHHAAWEKIAIVTDQDRVRGTVRLISKVVPGTVKLFANRELDEARAWIEK